MDPNEWDAIWWYRDMRYPRVFRTLMGCQRDPRVLGRSFVVMFAEYFKVRKFSFLPKGAKIVRQWDS